MILSDKEKRELQDVVDRQTKTFKAILRTARLERRDTTLEERARLDNIWADFKYIKNKIDNSALDKLALAMAKGSDSIETD